MCVVLAAPAAGTTLPKVGALDPKNRRFLVGPKTMYSKKTVCIDFSCVFVSSGPGVRGPRGLGPGVQARPYMAPNPLDL